MTPARPWRRALAWLALLAPFFYLSYGLANHLAAARPAVPSLAFEWERQIPFWPWTIVPYWSLNGLYGLSLLLARNRHELDRHAARLLSVQVVAVACFIAWPLRFAFGQPAVDGPPGWLFAALRGFDQPFNQAPSLHIALAVVVWDSLRRSLSHPVARHLLALWMLAIGLSVLTTWQHHFIDVPTGALLGVVCAWAWPLERRVAPWRAWRRARCAQRQRLATAYAAGSAGLALAAGYIGGGGLLLLWPAGALALVALNYAGLGARGFTMGRDGRMAWPARVLLAPYLAAARLNALCWTRPLPPARELWPGVWIGSLARIGAVLPASGATLVSLAAELPRPDGRTECRCLPWLDLVPPSPPALRRAASAIDGAVRRGDTVFVGCALGISRSAAALACWLVRSGRVRDLDAALALLRQAHPQAVLGVGWRLNLHQAMRG